MHLQVDAADLRSATRAALRAAGRTSSLAGGLLIEAAGAELAVAGCGGEVAIRRAVPADVRAEGRLLVHGRLLYEVASRLEGSVEIRGEERAIILVAGRTQMRLRGAEADLFPPVFRELDAAGDPVTLGGIGFADLAGRTAFAAATDDTRPALKGVCLNPTPEGLEAWATDGFRVARVLRRGLALPADGPVVVDARALAEAARLASGAEEVALYFGEKAVWARIGATAVRMPIVDASYPPLEDLMPRTFPLRAILDRQALASALARAQLMAGGGIEGTSYVVLDLRPGGGLVVTARAPEQGDAREEIPAAVEGQPLRIAFNPRYLLEGLRILAGGADEVEIAFSGPLTAAQLRVAGADDGTRYWVLPVVVREKAVA